MPWLVRFEGQELNTEDLTLDELEAIEKITEVPWILLNPVQHMGVAKSLLALCLIKGGLSDDQAHEKVRSVKVSQIHDAFELLRESDLPTSYTGGQPDPKAAPEVATSGSSGRGATSGGRRTSRARTP